VCPSFVIDTMRILATRQRREIHVLKNDKEGGAEDLELLYLWFKNALQMIIGRDMASL
jgi:hypothetical protein